MRSLWMLVMLLGSVTNLIPGVSWAGNEQAEDQVTFQVEVGRDVENDRVIAILNASAEDRKPAALADTINTTMAWALEQARSSKDVKSSSGSYQTYPVYDDKKIVRWRGRQQLQLESRNVDQLSELVGVLQNRLQIQSLQFSVSPDRRSRVEDELIQEALAAYQARADIVSKSLGAKGYTLLEVTLHTRDQRPPVPVVRAEAATLQRARVAPPAMEQGTSRINVQVSGKIRLRRE